MKSVITGTILLGTLVLSGCAQKCNHCNMEDEKPKVHSCPNATKTVVYLDRCRACGFPVTKRAQSNCKGAK